MKGFTPLLKKEIREQLRTYRLVIVASVFLLFGISNPLTIKYLPEIIKLAGDQQINIQFPTPTAVQSLASYAGDIGQIGVLVVVLIAMGCIATELRSGTAVLTLSKPVSRTAFVSAKLIAMSLTFLVSMIAASLACFGYTVWLIEGSSVLPFVGLNLLLGLFLVFCLAVTVFFSSLFKNSLAAGGIAITVLTGQGLISAIPIVGKYMPGKLLSWGTNLVSGIGDNYWWSLATTFVAIGLCVYFSQRFLKNRDL
jgi:ABC-2 type transport system permease protein